MNITGKYKISKNNHTIQTSNNLTIFGAIQLARLLKRDVTYPKSGSAFGTIVSYDGQYKKISIQNGSEISILDSSIISRADNMSQNIYMIDDNYVSSVQFKFNKISDGNSYQKQYQYIDIKLPNSIHLGKIGLMARFNNTTNVSSTSEESYRSINDCFICIQTESFNIELVGSQSPRSDFQSDANQLLNVSGDYFRVYNINYLLHNNRPYYICHKTINNVDKYYCLFFNKNHWVIDQVDLDSSYINNTKLLYSKFFISNVSNLDNGYLVDLNCNALNIDYSYEFTNNIVNQNNQHITFTVKVLQSNKWLKPQYRLSNYLIDWSDVNTTFDKQYRYMQMISDNKCIYQQLKNNNESRSIQYEKSSNNFDSYLCYNCYSFQTIQNITEMYNFSDSFDTTTVSDYNYENLIGFIPYVKNIRLCKRNNNNQQNNNNNISIYQIDLFQSCTTPYNPIKIALLQDQNSWESAQSFFVDTIQKKNDNTILFTKQLQSGQGNTAGSGFRKIGLFGNLDGYINSTVPTNIDLKDINCFSSATFDQPWTKTSQQQVILTYQLTIGD